MFSTTHDCPLTLTCQRANDDPDSMPIPPVPLGDLSPEKADLLAVTPPDPQSSIHRQEGSALPNNVRGLSPDNISTSSVIPPDSPPTPLPTSQTFTPRRTGAPRPDIADTSPHTDLFSSPDVPHTSDPCIIVPDFPNLAQYSTPTLHEYEKVEI